MRTPESVYLDEGSGYLYVSQIDGAAESERRQGAHLEARPRWHGRDGRLVHGACMPRKGCAVSAARCGWPTWTRSWASTSPRPKRTARIKIDGAKFLNDVATGADGTVYVSDMLASKIYAIKDGKATVFAEGEQLEHPNGLFVDGERLIVGGWGTKPAADFTTKVPGHLYMLDLKTKQKTLITKQPLGNIDGVEQEARGGFLVTDYLAGKVIQVAQDGSSRVVRTFKPGLADHTFLYAQGDILIVPHMNENTVAAYEIGAEMK